MRSTWNKEAPIWMLHQRSIILLSGLVGMLLSAISLRSVKLAIMVLAVSYYTTAATVALVPLTGGTMNMVLIVMPSLLFVLTLSGAIHLANYWKHAVKLQKPNPVSYAVEMAWLPCFLAGFTTCLGLISLVTSPLAPVRDFGIYSAAGCIISLLMVLIGLPSMLQIWASKPNSVSENSGAVWKSYAQFLCRNHVSIHTLCWMVVIVASLGFMYFRTETKVISYFTKESKIVQDYNYLEKNIAGVNQVDVIVRFSISDEEDEFKFLKRMEIVRKVQEKIATHPEISGTLSLADFFAVDTPPTDDQSRIATFTYNKKVTETYDRIFPEDSPKINPFIAKAKYDATIQDTDTKLCIKDDELWRITAQALVTKDNDYGLLIAQIDELVKSELKFHAQTRHFVTGMVPVFLRTQQAVLDSLINSFVLAYLMIGSVIVLALRNFFGGFIAMIPNLWPIAFVFGIISWAGWKIDIGTMVTASVALGIAVDGTLHLITWFQDALRKGTTRNEAISSALMHCAPAMVQTSAIVAIGLLVLAPADLLLISRFGILMAALIIAALIADIVFMPVILAGPLGKYLEVKESNSGVAPAVIFAEELIVEDIDQLNLESQIAISADKSNPSLKGPHKHPHMAKNRTT
jgi:predicted RND superfamily exporter protein